MKLQFVPLLFILCYMMISSCSITQQEKNIVGTKEIGGSHHECKFQLKANHTYTFKDVQRTNFCWSEGKGTWELKGDILTLTQTSIDDNCAYPIVKNNNTKVFKRISVSKFKKCKCEDLIP